MTDCLALTTPLPLMLGIYTEKELMDKEHRMKPGAFESCGASGN